jgi:hypothetical protein
MEMPSKEQIVQWHRVIMAHAKANYCEGWDTYVECFDASDLSRFIEDQIEFSNRWKKEWNVSLESIMKELKATFDTRKEYEDDIRAEARSMW